MSRNDLGRTILLLTLLPVTVIAQVQRDVAPLTSWPAPLYWQPSEAENRTTLPRLDRFGTVNMAVASVDASTPASSLVFVAMTPCRLVDTRTGSGFTGAFGPPALIGAVSRTFPMQSSSTCSIPSIAQAYSFNITIVPTGSVDFITVWPTGQLRPNASTLNDQLATIVANASITPAGTGGSVDVYASQNTNIIFDINGYYAPQSGITLAQGTAGAPSLSFAGDPGTGIFSSGAGALNIATGGTTRLSMASSGNVGIGTTTPPYKLSVVESGSHALYAKSDIGIGVWGDSTSNSGVYGSSALSTGVSYGVQGLSLSNAGAGIYGRNDKSVGVEGFSTNGSGVVGRNSSLFGAVFGGNSGIGPGVYGQTSSTGFNQAGVFGEATASSGTVVGVYGKAANDPNGTGVAGFGQATGGYFSASGTVGAGVGAYGIGDNTGLNGQSTNGTGVIASGKFGVSGFGHTGGFGGYFRNVDGEVALFVEGTGRMNVLQIAGGSDVAEHFAVVEDVKPGLVVAIDPDHPGQLSIARTAYSRRVAGIISGANNLDAGMVLADLPGAKNSLPVALSGRVWVYCDATRSAIQPGDLLTTSTIPGHAMKAINHAKAQGATLGKAMTSLKSGRGLVLVLVTLQ